MLNFTVGPVQLSEQVCSIGAEQIPYFRTEEFSQIMLENERLIKKFCKAEDGARAVFITGSGTASMEAAVMNLFSKKDKVLIVNGGSFGQRFVDICRIHDIPYTEIKLEFGSNITSQQLDKYDHQGYTGFLINYHETSTGVLYDLELVGDFCKRNRLFLVVDAISAFLADPLDMRELNIGAVITGSQKALACPPGVSVIVLSGQGVESVKKHKINSLYLDLAHALKDGERGQTPFTPAVGILLQLNARLKEIDGRGGVESESRRIRYIAEDFRSRITDLPLTIFSQSVSNAVTPLTSHNVSAYQVFLTLKKNYGIWVCPNGGVLSEKIFRVGHIGALSIEDNIKLVQAFEDMRRHNLL